MVDCSGSGVGLRAFFLYGGGGGVGVVGWDDLFSFSKNSVRGVHLGVRVHVRAQMREQLELKLTYTCERECECRCM